MLAGAVLAATLACTLAGAMPAQTAPPPTSFSPTSLSVIQEPTPGGLCTGEPVALHVGYSDAVNDVRVRPRR